MTDRANRASPTITFTQQLEACVRTEREPIDSYLAQLHDGVRGYGNRNMSIVPSCVVNLV